MEIALNKLTKEKLQSERNMLILKQVNLNQAESELHQTQVLSEKIMELREKLDRKEFVMQ